MGARTSSLAPERGISAPARSLTPAALGAEPKS